jgi:hypothetical protein
VGVVGGGGGTRGREGRANSQKMQLTPDVGVDVGGSGSDSGGFCCGCSACTGRGRWRGRVGNGALALRLLRRQPAGHWPLGIWWPDAGPGLPVWLLVSLPMPAAAFCFWAPVPCAALCLCLCSVVCRPVWPVVASAALAATRNCNCALHISG